MHNIREKIKPTLNKVLSFLLLIGIAFSVIKIAIAATPNPGHLYTESSGGVVLGDIIYGSGIDTLSKIAGAAGFLKSTGAAVPAWNTINLAASADVGTSILPTANGGTGLGTLTTGNVILGAGTGNVTFVAPGTSGNVLTSNGSTWTSAAAPGGSSGQPYYPTRQWCYLRPLGTTAIVFTSVGCAAFVSTGTGVASGQTDSYYIRQPSAATINTLTGISQTLIQTRGQYRPKLTALIRTDTAITSRRIWVGLHSVLNGTAASMQGSDLTGAQTDRYVGVRYSTSASDTQWQCCSGDGTTGSCSTTGVTVAVSTAYKIVVDWSVNGTLTCTVNGTSVNKTTNLDTTQTAPLGFHAAATTLLAAIIYHSTAFITLETN